MYLHDSIKLFFVIGIFNCFFNFYAHLRLYAFYTPSHKILFDEWFLPSVCEHDEYRLEVKVYEQECPAAEFYARGWTKTTIRKIDLIIRAIDANWGGVFVYSDVDVQFFRKTADILMHYIKNKDIVFQRDDPFGNVCTGFFICRACEETLQFFKAVYSMMKKNIKISDQPAVNTLLRTKKYPLRWGYLPGIFFGAGLKTGKIWAVGSFLDVPQNIAMHHANFCVGVSNKIAQLKYVRNMFLNSV